DFLALLRQVTNMLSSWAKYLSTTSVISGGRLSLLEIVAQYRQGKIFILTAYSIEINKFI
ncbi:MAG: hypothetical protein ACR2NC_00095, partial [Thermodesulfobacteriota bacterium]